MSTHSCLLCLGSNIDRRLRLEIARKALIHLFPDIRFSDEMETEAIGNGFLSPFSNQVALFQTSLSTEEIRSILKDLEQTNGRLPEDKTKGIVKLDIDLLKYDDLILKPKDMEKEYIQKGITQL